MPELSRFLGIIIAMFFKEHPPPHFHVKYENYRAVFDIQTLQMTEGKLPSRVKGYVVEWADQHRDELMENWKLMEQGKPLNKIQPLIQ